MTKTSDSDVGGSMPRLIGVFARRTCIFVGFVMRRLKLTSGENDSQVNVSYLETHLKTVKYPYVRDMIYTANCKCII